jgi:hypothetical protein
VGVPASALVRELPLIASGIGFVWCPKALVIPGAYNGFITDATHPELFIWLLVVARWWWFEKRLPWQCAAAAATQSHVTNSGRAPLS